MELFLTFVLFSGYPFSFSADAEMTLNDSGSGFSRKVTVESTGHFRLVFEAMGNWGLTQWYDLANDPAARANLIGPALGVNQTETTVAQAGLFNQVFYGTNSNDPVAYTNSVYYYWPSCIGTFTVIESNVNRVVVEAVSHPVAGSMGVLSNITNDITYSIYSNGKIYIHSRMTAANPQTATDWRCAVLGMEDPAHTTYSNLDSSGWIRASDTQNPYDYITGRTKYIFAYWNTTNSGAYNNWSKASVLLVPKGDNPYQGKQQKHDWIHFKRWYYGGVVLKMAAKETITQDYLIQLGTHGSAILPNINSRTVADPIANAYLANSTPPTVAGIPSREASANGITENAYAEQVKRGIETDNRVRPHPAIGPRIFTGLTF